MEASEVRMTAVMSQMRKGVPRRTVRRGVLCTLAMTGVWTVGIGSVAPTAVAEGMRSKQWYLEAMAAEELWKVSTGDGIKVAVIDSGVNASTPSLKGQVLKGQDHTGVKGDESDDYSGHGTTMAELIAGTGEGGGLRGLAPGAKVIPMRISNTELQNENPGAVNAHDAEEAIRAAADSDAQIISMSFGSEYSSPHERAAVEYAESKGKLFFAAVGNSAEEDNKPGYPAGYPQVAGVGAADRNARVSDYSQHGKNVDIAAPGDDIPKWCDAKFQSYCDGDGGTSAATAITSASAALVWSANPDWTANQVLRALFETASRTWKEGTLSNYLGHGVIRPRKILVDGEGDPGDPNLNPLTNEKTPSSSPSPTPSAPASPQAPKDKPSDDAVAAGSSATAEGDGKLGWILGLAAGVAVVAVGSFAVSRRHRNRA